MTESSILNFSIKVNKLTFIFVFLFLTVLISWIFVHMKVTQTADFAFIAQESLKKHQIDLALKQHKELLEKEKTIRKNPITYIYREIMNIPKSNPLIIEKIIADTSEATQIKRVENEIFKLDEHEYNKLKSGDLNKNYFDSVDVNDYFITQMSLTLQKNIKKIQSIKDKQKSEHEEKARRLADLNAQSNVSHTTVSDPMDAYNRDIQRALYQN